MAEPAKQFSLNITAIPEELQALKQWVAWRAIWNEERKKWDKQPVNPYNGRLAATNNPGSWGKIHAAIKHYERNGLAGIGFVFTKDDPYIGIDIDKCVNESRELSSVAKEIVDEIQSYTEYSPSGRGVHIIVKGTMPEQGNRNDKVGLEMYSFGRYFTFTGTHIEGTLATVEERSEAIKRIHTKYIEKDNGPSINRMPRPEITLSDRDLIEKAISAKGGERFSQLWKGDTSDYGGDHSRADQALCCMLAFWTGGDYGRIDSLFRQSGLYREKWDKRHYGNGDTYGQRTIQQALSRTREYYEPGQKNEHRAAQVYREDRAGVTVVDGVFKPVTELAPEFEPEAWEEPIPFSEYELPGFPLEVFPQWLQDHVRAVARSTLSPIDLAANTALGVISVATARKIDIRVHDSWREPLNIWLMPLLPPSEMKSPVVKQYAKVVYDFESELHEKIGAEVEQSIQTYDYMKKKLEAIKMAAAKAAAGVGQKNQKTKSELEYRHEIEELAEDIRTFQVKVYPKLLVGDVTAERLAGIIAEQGERIGILSPEGGLIFKLFSRYSKNGDVNLEVYLSSYTGEPYTVDRAGGKCLRLRRPALTMLAVAQPAVLQGLAGKKEYAEYRGKGLLGRFLYSIPKPAVGSRIFSDSFYAIPESIQSEYERRINALLQIDTGGVTALMQLELEAQHEFISFRKRLEPKLAANGEMAVAPDWGGKLHGQCIRLAGILHMIYHAGQGDSWKTPITLLTMKKAIKLCEDYYFHHALAAFSLMGESIKTSPAKIVLEYILSCGESTFTQRDLYRKFRGRVQTVKEMEEILAVLEEREYIHKLPTKKGTGRKSVVYEITPIRTKWTICQNDDEARNGAGSGVLTNQDKIEVDFGQNQSSSNIVKMSKTSKENEHDFSIREGEI
ncbi:hypothetical protein SPSIL_058360 [Sporomusa silvacetica DSM 10669]|uniref:NrS-1 polymerase-like HBD domain-containing protein n=1 Tax=Sporomusa silvacetica DSM 10669 TaxID=1123289 RepID=A0ABZ3IVA9_9FIRM|nr:DUF3987 domain-containing protein [Sporomusa silvacetica]OZC14216.1 hypothetical protein SPSIL_49430 [Sporomusa silvacetica DSM 10669]